MRARALAAVALALSLAGCGGGGSTKPKVVSGDLIVAAAAKSSRGGSVEADFTISGGSVKGSGSGVFNTDQSRSGRLKMNVEVSGQKVPIDSVVSGNVLYMRSPVFAQLGLPRNKEWVKLDLGQLAKQRGIDLSSFANASPTPASALAYLQGTSRVERLGSDTVQGLNTTHYKVTVDLARAADRSNGSTRKALRRVIQTTGQKSLPVDVWIDGDGYVRKVEYSQGSGNGKGAKVTMELHDYGAPVPVKPPPADSVVDLQKALGG